MRTKCYKFFFLFFVLQFIPAVSSSDLISPKPNFSQTYKKSLKILSVFSHPGKSHLDVFQPFLEELARRGHDLTVVSYFPKSVNKSNNEIPNYKPINLAGSVNILFNAVDLTNLPSELFLHTMIRFVNNALNHCEAALNVPEVRNLIRSNAEFDLIITESFNSDCFFGFAHKFKVPVIVLSTSEIMPWVNPRIGNPDNPSYIPFILSHSSPQMSFLERLRNSLEMNICKIVYEKVHHWSIQKIVEEAFGPGVPPLHELTNRMSALFVNTHFSIFGARPYVPNVIEIGGIHIKPAKPLPEDIKEFLDSGSEGVLLFSWGSMVKASTMSKGKLESILKVIGSIPRKVIWKWEIDEIFEKPKNLMIRKWLPQFDIMSK